MALTIDIDADITSGIDSRAMAGVRRYLEAGADKGFSIYIDRVPVDRGTLQQNSFSPVWNGDRLAYGTRDTPYARAQDEGTGPIPNLPIQPLLEWGERVNAPGGAVWHHIKEEGIEAKHFSRDAAEAQRRWYASHDASAYIDRQFVD